MRNPFRNESDAFWVLGVIGLGIGAIVIGAVIAGPWGGVPVGLAVLGYWSYLFYGWVRRALASRGTGSGRPEQVPPAAGQGGEDPGAQGASSEPLEGPRVN